MLSEKRSDSRTVEIVCLLFAAALALPVVVYWHWVNRGYPIGDSADYMWTSMKIFRGFSLGGALTGLKATYFFRLWKPIFHPVLAVPALILTQGRAVLSQALTVTCLQGLLAVSVYKLAKNYLPRLESALAAGVLLNFHWMSSNANDLNSELPFILGFFATWAALFGSDGFNRKKESLAAAVFMGLAIAIRPAEGVLLFSIPLALYVAFAVRAGKLPLPELRMGVAEGLVCALPPALILFFHERFDWPSAGLPGNSTSLGIVIAGVVVGVLVHLRAHREANRGSFRSFALISISTAAIWYGPYLWHAMAWMQLTSFHQGGVNVETENRLCAHVQKIR